MQDRFTYRSDEKELLDEPNLFPVLLYKNLRELDILNRTTGGHAITIKGIKQLITDPQKIYRIVDLGCGSGDSLRAIADWARENNYRVQLTGVDWNDKTIAYLKNHCKNYPEISGITADYKDYLKENVLIDIVHCSLFCHHLTDNELKHLFSYFAKYIKIGFVINDLKRHWIPYYIAWFFTRVFNGSLLAKNDGPVSVLRGFKYEELIHLLEIAGIRNFSVKKEIAYRYLIVGKSRKHESIV